MARPIRVAILHHSRLFREGLALALSQQQNIAITGCVAQVAEFLEEAANLRPDVAIMVPSRPGQDGLREARQLCNAFPAVKILMIGITELESDVLACIEAGAAGYLSQEASLEDLLKHIRAVVAGEALCSPKVAGFIFSRIAQRARQRQRLHPHLTRLTGREREIIDLIEAGLSNKEIAVHLRREVQTVKNHVHNILEKLQLENRREVARYAREQGLLSNMY